MNPDYYKKKMNRKYIEKHIIKIAKIEKDYIRTNS